jgi:CheY-like chemotaxis protein
MSSEAPAPIPPITDPATGVLIIDDSPQFSMVLSRLLVSLFGYKDIQVVHSCEEGYSRLSADTGALRLVFLDFRFPSGMNGADLLQRLHAEERFTGRRIFFMSSDPSADMLRVAEAVGVLGVIAKPFKSDQLKRQIESAVRLDAAEDTFSF